MYESISDQYDDTQRIMGEVITAVLSGLGGLSSAATAIVALAILVFAGVLYVKKTNIEEVTSVGSAQHQQIDTLLDQVKFLSEELSKAREQISAIHEQNLRLMYQVRESSLKIQELEDVIHKRNIEDGEQSRPT